MRVDVLGGVAVREGTAVVSGRALGGRRPEVLLAYLALAEGAVTADQLAAALWPADLPPTWQAALRGVVRGLRRACRVLGADDQAVVETVPAGYRLATGTEVDVRRAALDLRRAAAAAREGRSEAALELAEPVARLVGATLLPVESAPWLAEHRQAVDTVALQASHLVVETASVLGEHGRAVDAARRTVARHQLDEGAHRDLITALDRSGDRAGAVRAFETCRASLADQLGVDPSEDTVRAYLEALGDAPARSVTAAVPVGTSSFVGRAEELDRLAGALVAPGVVTVVGRGGTGKSRLAAHAALAGRREFPGGRLWVSLATVVQDALVPSGVALALGVTVGQADPADAVADHLAPLGRVLLVLDGCEAVVDGVASLLATLLPRAPMVTVLATSRSPLDVDPGVDLPLAPWPAPSGEDDLAGGVQLRLLTDRVREAGGELVLTDSAAPALLELCRRCAGLPLALELVAAQLAEMPAGDLLDQLDHLDDVTVAPEDALVSIARGSYALLTDDEATVFRRLAVLDGSVGLPLLRQVVAGGDVEPVRVVRILRELAARGLVTVDRSGPRWRYQHDDDLRRFAGGLLRDRGEERTAYRALADAIRGLLPDDARADPRPYQAEISALIGSVRSLFTAALAGDADPDDGQEIAFRLHRWFASTGVTEGRLWLKQLLAGERSSWTPYIAYALGYLSYWAGRNDDAMHYLGQAVAAWDDGRPNSYRARALVFLGGLLDDADRGAEALEYVRLSIEASAGFDVDLQVSTSMGVGSVLAERGDPTAADYARDAIELARTGATPAQLSIALPTAAMICWEVGALDLSRGYVEEALPLNAGEPRIARVVLLSTAAGVALADGRLDAAADFGETAAAEGEALGIDREMPLILAVLARILLARGDVAGATARCAQGLESALRITVDYPLAVGLETAALILQGAGADVAHLLAAAEGLRRRGDRPPPAPLAPAVQALRAEVGAVAADGEPSDARAAARAALDRLASR